MGLSNRGNCRLQDKHIGFAWKWAICSAELRILHDSGPDRQFHRRAVRGASIGGEVQGALPGIEPLIGKASFQAVRGAQTGGNILLYPPGEGFIAGIQGDAQDSGLLIQAVQQGGSGFLLLQSTQTNTT